MKLENIYPQKKGTKVSVNGTFYYIGDGGFICDEDTGEAIDVPKEDADRLLQGKAWRPLEWDPSDPENAHRFGGATPSKLTSAALGRPPRSAEEIATMSSGKPVEPLVEEITKVPKSEEEILAEVAAAEAPVSEEEKVSEEVDAAVDEVSGAGVGYVGEDGTRYVIPGEGADWPDPTAEMPMDYLRAMADAYEVKHKRLRSPAKLVTRIMGAMYPEGE